MPRQRPRRRLFATTRVLIGCNVRAAMSLDALSHASAFFDTLFVVHGRVHANAIFEAAAIVAKLMPIIAEVNVAAFSVVMRVSEA